MSDDFRFLSEEPISMYRADADTEIIVYSVCGMDQDAVAGTAERQHAQSGCPVLAEWRFGLPDGPRDWPCHSLMPESGNGPYGTQWLEWTGGSVDRICQDNRVVGSVWDRSGARHCLLAGVVPESLNDTPQTQAASVFQALNQLLYQTGLPMTAIGRTWFYNRQILDWYPAFNAARHRVFSQHGLFTHRVPASTGIGTANALGAALMAGAYACSDDVTRVRALPSPLQCPALTYGSAFSRAVRIETPSSVWVSVSGTASIAPDGASAHIDDLESQIELTLQVVQAILADQGMDWIHVRRSIAYVQNAQGAGAYTAFHRRRQLPFAPFVVAVDHICRRELLFEIELDACIDR